MCVCVCVLVCVCGGGLWRGDECVCVFVCGGGGSVGAGVRAYVCACVRLRVFVLWSVTVLLNLPKYQFTERAKSFQVQKHALGASKREGNVQTNKARLLFLNQ